MVSFVEIDHRQAVGGRSDRMSPPELGTRRAVLHCLPDQFAGVGVGLQQSNHVAADLADVVVLDAAAQAGQEARAERLEIGLVAA